MRKTVLSGAIALAIISFNVNALSVGEMDVKSFLGEPLNVSIDLSTATKSELSTLEVVLAPRESFEQANISYPENAEDLVIEVDSSNKAGAKILVKSINSITEPFVHLLLKISWAGGNMLREYTALIDPTEYKPQPMAKAAASNTKLGVAKPVAKAETAKKNNGETPKVHGRVKSGDSLSAIAALYRPADVTIHQAWMAFYKLNPKAFPDNNLNRIQKGSQILVPTRAQMMAISQSKAAQAVKKLAKPLRAGDSAQVKKPAGKTAPKLVVGGGKDEEPAQAAGKDSKKKSAKSSKDTSAAGADHLASIKAEFSAFKDDVTRKLDESRAQTTQAKEQLVAAQGQNRVLNERIAELEKQLSNVSSLLELQKQAVQALSEDAASSASDQAAMSAEDKDAAALQSTQTTPGGSDANTDAPAGESTSTDGDSAQGSSADSTAEENAQEQAKIAESKQRIALLEKELQEKSKLEAQLNAQAQEAIEQSNAAPEAADEPAQPQQVIAANDPAPAPAVETQTPRVQADQTFTEKSTGVMGSISSILAGISGDIWKIIGVIAAALLGLFVYSGARRRREEEFDDEDSFVFSEMQDLGDEKADAAVDKLIGEEDSLPGLQANLPIDDDADGSALFDLSDESFMASEAVENESSLFAMDEEFGSFGNISSDGTAVSALQSSIPQMGDVDPVTEAEVYLAYDRKEQAINVLEQAMQENPNQGKVVSKLLTLYRDADDVEAFTRVFESSVENVEDDGQWGDIKQLAQEFIPTHKFVDDFDSSIPVLHDELVEDTAQENPADMEQPAIADIAQEADNQAVDSIELAPATEDDDDILAAAIQELEDSEAQPLGGQSDVLVLDDDDESELDEASMMFVEDEKENTDPDGDKDELDGLDLALENEQEQGDTQDKSLDHANDTASEQDADLDIKEVDQHDPETALALAKAYIELGENDIAKDFLKDVIDAGSEKIRGEAQALLATVS